MSHRKIARLFTVALIAGFLSAYGKAAIAETQTGPAVNPELMASQIDITHSAVDQLVRQLENRAEQNEFKVSDYRALTPKFQDKVQQGLIEFENALTQSIMKKLGFWVDRYNSIVNSKAFAEDQKRMILAKQLELMYEQAKLIEDEYHREIAKVYQLVGDLPYDLQLTGYEHYGDDTPAITDRLFKKYHLPLGTRSRRNNSAEVWVKRFLVRTVRLNSGLASQSDIEAGDFVEPTVRYKTSVQSHQQYGDIILDSDDLLDKNREKPFLVFGDDLFSVRVDRAEPPAPLKDELLSAFLAVSTDFYKSYASRRYARYAYPVIAEGCRSQLCVGLRASDLSFFIAMVRASLDRDIQIRLADGQFVKLNATNRMTAITQLFLSRTNYPVELPFDTEQ